MWLFFFDCKVNSPQLKSVILFELKNNFYAGKKMQIK